MKSSVKDKLFAFVGIPALCTRKEAYDELLLAGGIIEDSITTFLHYVVAFPGAEKTVRYRKAVKLAIRGFWQLSTRSSSLLRLRTVLLCRKFRSLTYLLDLSHSA
jgi:hypothetical protein